MPSYTERTAAIYRATYRGCTERMFTDQETGADVARWVWRFQEVGNETSTGELSKITGTSLQSPNSNAYKLAAGVVGRKLEQGDDTEKFIGQLYDVVWGPNQAGNLTITSVVKVMQPPPATLVEAREQRLADGDHFAGMPEPEKVANVDDLPF